MRQTNGTLDQWDIIPTGRKTNGTLSQLIVTCDPQYTYIYFLAKIGFSLSIFSLSFVQRLDNARVAKSVGS